MLGVSGLSEGGGGAGRNPKAAMVERRGGGGGGGHPPSPSSSTTTLRKSHECFAVYVCVLCPPLRLSVAAAVAEHGGVGGWRVVGGGL